MLYPKDLYCYGVELRAGIKMTFQSSITTPDFGATYYQTERNKVR